MRVAIVPSTVGFHWEEVYDAYRQFKKAGWSIDLYTVDAKPATADPKSLEYRSLLSFLGLGVRKSFSPDAELGKEISYMARYEVQAIASMNVDAVDVIYIPGGHGCLFDVNSNEVLHQKILEAYHKGKMLSAVCHGTSSFAFVEEGGRSIVAGKKMTGFPDFLDNILLKAGWVYKAYTPLPFSNEQKMRKAGAVISRLSHLWSIINPFHRVTDLPFITGVGPKAAGRVAKKVVRLLAREEKERMYQMESELVTT